MMRKIISIFFLMVLSMMSYDTIAHGRRHSHFNNAHYRGGYYRYPGFSFYFGSPYYIRPYYPYYPYYQYYAPPVVTVPTEPPVYIERDKSSVQQDSLPAGYWYYCTDPDGYYPYVKECNTQWRQVEPVPAK